MTTHDTTCQAGSPAETVLDLLRRQQDLVRRLLMLAQQQETYFSSDHAADLLEHMKRRQQVVDDMSRVQNRIASLLPDERDLSGFFPETELAEFKELRDAVTDDLARIAHLDRQGQLTVRRMRDEVAARLGQVAAGQGAVTGYGRTGQVRASGNRYTDRSA